MLASIVLVALAAAPSATATCVDDASYTDEWSTPAAEAKEPPTGVIDAGKAVIKTTTAEAATARERDDAPLASVAP